MAQTTPSRPTAFLFLAVLLLTAAQPSQSFSYFQYRNLFSFGHSLMTRVANLRAERGDVTGSNRARDVAAKMELGLGLGPWGFMWSAGWDYVKNYAWRELPYSEVYGVVSDANELLRWLDELGRQQWGQERAAWVGQNYQSVLRVSNSMLRRLLQVFYQSGTLREVVKTVQREVVDGELLRDCLELGANDLQGVIQILKDLGLQYGSSAQKTHQDL